MVPPDLKSRVLATVAAIPAPTRGQLLRRQARLIAAGIAGALSVFWMAGGVRVTERPPSLVAWTGLGTACFTGAGMWFLFRRGRTGLRRGWAAVLLATIVSTVAFVLWRHGLGDLYHLAGPWPDRTGYRCFAMSVAVGGVLLGAALLAWRRVDPLTPRMTGAAFGAGAGLGSALLVDLWCPVFYVPHLLLGHVLPIAVLAAAGAALGVGVLGADRRAARARTP
jgi:negative regulator of sigma F NrsF-like protein